MNFPEKLFPKKINNEVFIGYKLVKLILRDFNKIKKVYDKQRTIQK